MKNKLIVSFILIIATIHATRAGNNENFINTSVGYMFPKGYSATIAYEHEYLYQHGLEIFIDYYGGYSSGTWNTIRQVTGGIAYKLPLVRSKNSMLRLRGAFEGGSDMHNFVYGPEIGFEYAHSINNKFQIIFQQKNEYNFGAQRKFHSGLMIGFRTNF